jgi:hypothetical protein
MKIDKSKVEKIDIEYRHSQDRKEGVHTFEGKLVWYCDTWPPYGSSAKEQSFEDFLKNGPAIEDVPQHVIQKLRKIIKVAIIKE